MTSVNSGAVIVVWKQSKWEDLYDGEDNWPKLRALFQTNVSDLDAKCAAILSGPIRFNLDASAGFSMLLPHLAGMKNLGRDFTLRTMLDLHDNRPDAAWTNLLATTRLATAWEPEPIEISQLVRFALARIAFETTWQALQSDAWNDPQLARLQSEWESADYFKNLPETAAYARACAVAMCLQERSQPSGFSMNELIREPKYTADAYLKEQRYRHSGTYEDEKALLLHFRDREMELRNATKSETWIQMRQLPAVTNVNQFRSTNGSRLQSMMNLRALGTAYQQRGIGFVGCAAEVEAQRRVLIAAIALKRFHLREGKYPKSIAELSPSVVTQPLMDFVDGKPLRYRLMDNEHFILYSIGLDGVDNGGMSPLAKKDDPSAPEEYGPDSFPSLSRKAGDLLWPAPASAGEISTHKELKRAEDAARTAAAEDQEAAAHWDFTEHRQTGAERLLAENPAGVTNGVMYKGRPLTNMLRNRTATGTNKLSLAEMLTLHPVLTGDEPETVTFEAPLAFDSVNKVGRLSLIVDPVSAPDSYDDESAVQFECKRATNGNCRITWSTFYECPGVHALRLDLELNEPDESSARIFGPLGRATVTNLCQFTPACVSFDPENGAIFHARLEEQNGRYVIDMTDTNGVHLKTITGNTTNGIIKEHWDLMDERGQKFTNDFFNCLFDLTLPESGRRQKLRF